MTSKNLRRAIPYGTILAGVLCLFGLSQCSDNPVSSGDATMTMQAELTTNIVNKTILKGEGVRLAGATVDSMRITRVRTLISQLKLHRDKEDSISGDHLAKVGPIVVTFDSSGAHTFTNATIPAGAYDKVKFEFHRLASSEVATYLADSTFADFVTDDRWTVIVDGSVFINGSEFPFTYRSDMTANLTIKLDSAVTINGGTTVIIVVQIDPLSVFRDGTLVLDPRDGKNEQLIDNAIKSTIHCLKK